MCVGLTLFVFQPCVAQEKPTELSNETTWTKIVVPESTDVNSLNAFLDETKARKPANAEQYVEMQNALRTASKKIVDLVNDPKSEMYRKAEAEFVSASVFLLGNEGPDAQRATFERFRDYLRERPTIEFNDIQMAVMAGQNLEQLADLSLAKEAYITFAKLFKEKNDPNLAEIIPMLEANARRLDLPGKEFNLIGSTIEGDDFDVTSLRGKVVLIYFWSSSSKACELEQPFMLSIYNKYKDRGFEIVGICLDDSKEVAQSFIKRLNVPWNNLWEERKNGASMVMETFGVSAIPTLFLLDKEGKVITIEARGLVLSKGLEKLFPDPATPSAPAAESKSATESQPAAEPKK